MWKKNGFNMDKNQYNVLRSVQYKVWIFTTFGWVELSLKWTTIFKHEWRAQNMRGEIGFKRFGLFKAVIVFMLYKPLFLLFAPDQVVSWKLWSTLHVSLKEFVSVQVSALRGWRNFSIQSFPVNPLPSFWKLVVEYIRDFQLKVGDKHLV